MYTKLTSDFPISEKYFKDLLVNEIKPFIDEYINNFNIMLEKFTNLYSNRYIFLTNNFVYDSSNNILIPNFDKYELTIIKDYKLFDKEKFLEENIILEDIKAELPTYSWLRSISNMLKNFLEYNIWILCVCDDGRYSYCNDIAIYNVNRNVISNNFYNLDNGDSISAFPIFKLSNENSNNIMFLKNICCKYKIMPEKFEESIRLMFYDYCKLQKYITIDNGKVSYSIDLIKDLINGKNNELFSSLHINLVDVLKEYIENKKIEKTYIGIKEILLNCEKLRADIEPYEERILTDPNRGHWDLWLDNDKDSFVIKMANTYMARNPKYDINEEGVIAIDFGTKSTIVVYQSDIEHSLPMGIGDGNLSKSPTPKRYENPTIMEFVNLEKFLKDYKSKDGRPNTFWEDLPISHTAMDKFKNSRSEDYYAFLHQIKQWAGQREKQFRIQPINGESILLPSFMDLTEEDVNPIEIYAYYIGLYINNMRKGHGIFLDYYLAFPVTYETKIREKIIKSFEKGLKKSLPISIQKDDEIMSRFKVNGDISEPAAYAVCALQEYGFEPDEDEEIFYGIFDFGGGTTDFDFGLWTLSKKRRYDYKIENFGAGGDEFLGGENLLEMLAFEIFKENQNIMRENNYTFTLAPKSKEFLGSDALLSNSQEAEKNMHNLMEMLRPYWENTNISSNDEYIEKTIDKIIDHILNTTTTSMYYNNIIDRIEYIKTNYEYYSQEFIDAIMEVAYTYDIDLNKIDELEDITIYVTLFDKEGKDHPNVELNTTKTFIDSFIESKIREGINNFFAALLLSYQNEKVKKPTNINILLAGNSCKSPIVKKVFEEEIAKQENLIKEKYNLDNNQKFFEVFPPLGTKEAYKKMKERGLSFNEYDFERPTCKTGVAFGLIQCRIGGTIERVNNIDKTTEIPFQYFLGWQSRKKFVLFKDDTKLTTLKGKPDYNEWYKFIEADADTFYLYYTTLPECVSGNLFIEGNAAVNRIKCNIDNIDEDAFVYIRAVSPHTIQYAVSKDYDVDKNIIGNIYTRELG